MCRHSVLPGVLKITYSLFGIGTSASRERHGIIYPFPFSMCCCHSLVPINGEEKTEEKKKEKFRGVGGVIAVSRKGFFLSLLHEKPNPSSPASPCSTCCLTAGGFMLPPPSLQPCYRGGKKKPWHSKNVNVAISLHSALKKGIRSETVTEGNPRG